ncbi:T9SS type A sorting domain-containing protein [Flavobacterium antarcticum]|uniref:T9SS type A sorting domain-containing protein n=1 Tax=Flavobacterium antarcticum TaxID=271155 RepID=UPI0003B6BD47|nr:T9SS type A sorting domain-containing protein [Flavobacterium antarcticum]
MKKITLAIALCSLGLNAQSFPAPYCDISATGTTTEAITIVNFAGTVINNSDVNSILINQTAVSVSVVPNQVYTLQVSGDTKGNFGNDVVAFIDWNNNGVLDDAGEVYEIGTLENSTGADGASVSMDITVPAGTIDGIKRIRLTKIYGDPTSESIINPCAISFDPFGFGANPGYGQALDFTLNVESLSVSGFDKSALAVYPIPATDHLTISYNSTIESVSIYNLLGQEVFAGHQSGTILHVDVSNFTAGTYIAKIISGGNTETVKIIKR